MDNLSNKFRGIAPARSSRAHRPRAAAQRVHNAATVHRVVDVRGPARASLRVDRGFELLGERFGRVGFAADQRSERALRLAPLRAHGVGDEM